MLETDRLLIRPTILEDAAFIYELLNSPDWIENIGQRNVHSIEEAMHYIEYKMLAAHEKNGFGNCTVILKENNQKIGTCGLYTRAELEFADIGYALLPAYYNRGYALEAAQAMKYYALESLKFKGLMGITRASNHPSQRLLKKLGLHYRNLLQFPDEKEAICLFELPYI